MKRIIYVLLFLLLISGCAQKEQYDLNKTQGRLLLCNDNTYVLIYDNTAVSLDVESISNIADYSDGDLLEVWHDMVLTTYPGQTKAYKIKLIEEGNMADVDEYVARRLCDMGWIDYDDMASRYFDAGYIIDCETPDTKE